MNREEIQGFINQGYQVLKNGTPINVEGDIWEYLDQQDEADEGLHVLEELLKLSDEEIGNIEIK